MHFNEVELLQRHCTNHTTNNKLLKTHLGGRIAYTGRERELETQQTTVITKQRQNTTTTHFTIVVNMSTLSKLCK